MRLPQGRLVGCACVWLLAAAATADNEAHTEMSTSVGYRYGTEDDRTAANVLELAPSVEFDVSEGVSGRLSARARFDRFDLLQPGEPDFDSYEEFTKPAAIGTEATIELRDAYLDINLDRGVLRLGKQQIVWGALDGIKVLDALNPQSFEDFILEDFDASRIGLWSAHLDLSLGDWRAEIALIPDRTVHYVPEPGAWFELTAPRYRFGQTDPSINLETRGTGADDDSGTLGLRVSRYIGGLDVQAVAISGTDFEPLARLTVANGNPVLTTYHERRRLLGVSLGGSFSAFAWRAEMSFSPDRYFSVRHGNMLDHVRLDQFRGAVGFDINGPWGTFVNVQYLHDQLDDAPDGTTRPEEERIVTAFLRKRFAYDTFDVELRGYRSLEFDDHLVRASVEWAVSDNTRLKLAIDEFEGTQTGAFGQFDRRDLVSLTLEHTL
jgi:hypothetical protein